jgi:thiol-disulfide isomerase/thioredoxin
MNTTMMLIVRHIAAAALLVTVAACGPSSQDNAVRAPAAQESQAAIAWFGGTVDEAFTVARADNKLLLIFWGAKWCPFCEALRKTVFTRADFIEKSRMFVPVFLDGDLPGAQRWGEEFKISGYPSVLILKSDRRELARISGGMDLTLYARLLDDALQDERPVSDILASVSSPGSQASTADCHRLAYDSWDVEADAAMLRRMASQMSAAAMACRGHLTESDRLYLHALMFETDTIAGNAPDPVLAKRVAILLELLRDPHRSRGVFDLLVGFDAGFFASVAHLDSTAARSFHAAWIDAMMAAASDTNYGQAERLGAIDSALQAAKDLNPDHAVPKDLELLARERVDQALAADGERDRFARGDIVHAAKGVYQTLGDDAAAYALLKRELPNTRTPYYYMSGLAALDEKNGHPDLALDWMARAYAAAQGPATRAQWGDSYVRGLIRITPNDVARIAETTFEVLAELKGAGPVHARTKMRIDRMMATLDKWASTPQRRTVATAAKGQAAILERS